jgi:GxxExxY protein
MLKKTEDVVVDWVSQVADASAKDDIFRLCDLIREVSFAIHVYLRCGHLEKVYENSLTHRLRKRGLKVIQQHPIKVYDEDGTLLGSFVADLFVEDKLIIELKACAALRPEHRAQVEGYLRAARMEHALLINFGSPKLEVKKLFHPNNA